MNRELIFRVVIALLYCTIISWIYLNEIVPKWGYMGFRGASSPEAIALSCTITAILSAISSQQYDTRGIILNVMLYLFFIPCAAYLSYSGAYLYHYISFFILIVGTFGISKFPIKAPLLVVLTDKSVLVLTFWAIFFAILIQAAYGGLANFNLDIDRVYEFRQEDALRLPYIFGYLYSNVASVLIPIALTLAFRFGRYSIVLAVFVATVILFGMSHQKSVLFGPIAVAILYIIFSKVRSLSIVGLMFLALPLLSAIEVIYIQYFLQSSESAYWTSVIIRRVLFVPPMLDSFYIEFFSIHKMFFWSNSLLGSWAVDNPYDVPAPFVIGYAYFQDLDSAANTGVIGSGFANAGLIGVLFYSSLTGILIAILNDFGRRIGHAFVAAASLATIVNVTTSTDFLTAILSHGLLLLILLLASFPIKGATR